MHATQLRANPSIAIRPQFVRRSVPTGFPAGSRFAEADGEQHELALRAQKPEDPAEAQEPEQAQDARDVRGAWAQRPGQNERVDLARRYTFSALLLLSLYGRSPTWTPRLGTTAAMTRKQSAQLASWRK